VTAISGAKPSWLRRRLPAAGASSQVSAIVREQALHTVCIAAHCPNQLECFSKGTATFLLLGPACTRRCTFCAVDKGAVHPPDPREPERTAAAIAALGVDFCVLTMVTRDDLPDGGAQQVAQTIAVVRRTCPGTRIEVLISDLGGNQDAVRTVLDANPDVLNHNLETVPRLYPQVRPQADYQRSLEILAAAAGRRPDMATKSGLMLGLGETQAEILQSLDDLRAAGCDLLTLGQYLAPSRQHHPVRRYVPPEEFTEYEAEALGRGFAGVASAPLVRSSYLAASLYRRFRKRFPLD
jgi:lipoyl synthase